MALEFIKEGEEQTRATGLVDLLGAQARERLALLTLVVGGIIVVLWLLRLLFFALEIDGSVGDPLWELRPLLHLGQFALCASVYAFVRAGKGTPRAVLNLGLAFEVVFAALSAVGAYYRPHGASLLAPTWLTVWS